MAGTIAGLVLRLEVHRQAARGRAIARRGGKAAVSELKNVVFGEAVFRKIH